MADCKIDLRSDTITLPTAEMREAMYKCEVGDDVLQEDPTINELEAYAADLLGKEAALFVPSGTFANQCAIMTHTKSTDEVIAHEECHIIQHEAGASALVSRVQLRNIMPENGKFLTAAEIKKRMRIDNDIHYPDTGLICLEQATAYGNVYPLEVMSEICILAHKHGIPVHIDGARLFNAAVSLEINARELAAFGDSVSICLSKGLCAPVGSLLLGTKDFVLKARKNRKILGGGMRQAGFLAAAGLLALRAMTKRLEDDHKNARLMVELLGEIDDIEVTRVPEISMVFFKNLSESVSDKKLLDRLTEQGILSYAPEAREFRFVMHHGITADDVRLVADTIRKIVS